MRRFITLLVCLLPACELKNTFLRWLGHSVGHDVRIGPCFICDVRRLELGDRARIGIGNVFRGLDLAVLGENARIGHWNWISASPAFRVDGTDGGLLRLGANATIVSRHFIDCSGGVLVDEYALLAGLRSVLLTHQVDYRTCTMSASSVTIGAYSLVNACNKVVPGAHVPARSITAMGAVILPGLEVEGRLYGGVPARDIQAVEGRWFDRVDPRIEV